MYKKFNKKKKSNHTSNQARKKIQREKARWYHIKKTYGLTEQQWHKILEDQGGVCYMCKRTPQQIRKSKSKYLTVDHCHKTGVVRGLLCVNCNGNILPPFEADWELALRIVQYLNKSYNYGVIPNHV